jgi:hypothetical protein
VLCAHHEHCLEIPYAATWTAQLLRAGGLRSSVPVGGAHEVLLDASHLLRRAIDGDVAPREHWTPGEGRSPILGVGKVATEHSQRPLAR